MTRPASRVKVPSLAGTHNKKPQPFSINPKGLSSLISNKPAPPPWQVLPQWFPGSGAEWAIYWALLKLKVQFQYQANVLGGRKLLGGAVADFYIPDQRLVIRVQGVHWHYGLGLAKIDLDQLQKQMMVAYGMQVVDIDEDDALRDPLYFTRLALQGIDLSRATRGL